VLPPWVTEVFLANPCSLFITALSICRLYLLSTKKDKINVFSDGLLSSSFFYVMAITCLGFVKPHYFLPPVVLAMPMISSVTSTLLKRYKNYSTQLLIVFLPMIILSNYFCTFTSYLDRLYADKQTARALMSYFVQKYKVGKEILYFWNNYLLKNAPLYDHERWYFNSLNAFLAYYLGRNHIPLKTMLSQIPLGYRFNGADNTIVRYSTNIEDFTKDSIVISSCKNFYSNTNNLVNKLEKMDFVFENLENHIDRFVFSYRQLNKISLPLKSIFASAGVANFNLRHYGFCAGTYNCNGIFCIFSKEGVISGGFEGRIKFKVKAQDLIVSLNTKASVFNQELRGNDISFLVNGKFITNLKLKDKKTRKITFKIPKKDIKNDTVVITVRDNKPHNNITVTSHVAAALVINQIEVRAAKRRVDSKD
jgi:hypothetical protein